MRYQKLFLAFSLLLISSQVNSQTIPDTSSIKWREGYLDIHFILTGSGDCSFTVMPDGTTLLIDAGDIGNRAYKKSGFPLKSTDPYPDSSKTAGQWIADYISQVFPSQKSPAIDYALLTHFHDDHIGGISPVTPMSAEGGYKLTGITEVGSLLPIGLIIDRNYPSYDFPTDLRKAYKTEPSIFLNLLRFIEYQKSKGLRAEQLKVGSTSQLFIRQYS